MAGGPARWPLRQGRRRHDDLQYAGDAKVPISLSLPLDGSWREESPGNFLDALLPEGEHNRLRMMSARGSASTSAFDLLDSVDAIVLDRAIASCRPVICGYQY